MPRILLIDDEMQIRALFEMVLKEAGYEVTCASNGIEGVKMFRNNPFDLVITDIMMPEKDGIEVISELRNDFPDLKIIVISGGGYTFGPETLLEISEKLGAQRTFTKPLEWQVLLNAVKEIIG